MCCSVMQRVAVTCQTCQTPLVPCARRKRYVVSPGSSLQCGAKCAAAQVWLDAVGPRKALKSCRQMVRGSQGAWMISMLLPFCNELLPSAEHTHWTSSSSSARASVCTCVGVSVSVSVSLNVCVCVCVCARQPRSLARGERERERERESETETERQREREREQESGRE